MDGVKTAKKRKLTDKSIPNALAQLPEFAQESKMYSSLLEMEKKLDWTMTRKRVEVQDALARNPTTTRTLRVFVSHTISGQPWQIGEADGEGDPVNFETGQGIPAWSLKVEGRLLEPPNQRSRDKVAPRKFSTFIKRMIVELDRDPRLYPDGNIVEWPRPQGVQPPLDGFTVRRTGDQPTRVRILIYLEQTPEQYKVSPDLAYVLGIKEESRIGVIQTLWNYIKLNGLQDKVDRRRIRADDYLRPIFGGDSIIFQQLPELVNRHLMPPDPIILYYTFNPGAPLPERPSAWDIEVKMEDTAAKNRMAVIVQSSKESAQDLSKLDDEISLLAQSLHNSHTKRVFLQSFASDPAKFIQTWLESQSRDLESILGSGPSEGATIRAEELRRSDFFRLPWVEEAVAIQEGWAGEKISSRDKTVVVEDELKELEQDIELRKQGILRLQAASEDYHHVISKKKESPSSGETEKLMPLDALGIVMVTHGEEYGNESAFGTCLVAMGRAHCKIATLQEAYGLTFRDTFITSCESFAQDIKDYEYQRKKLDSRRLSYDAAITKFDKIKNCKKEKEKERREAEDELQRCRLRFEETSEDVRSRIQTIQENEILQLRELTNFLDIQLNFAREYSEILDDVKASWCDELTLTKFDDMRVKSQSQALSSVDVNKYHTIRSKRSTLSNRTSSVESDHDPGIPTPVRRKSDAERSIILSRPTSRTSRKRSDSNITAAGNESATKPNKRKSVTGWASNAVSSIAGLGKKDRDTFTALVNGDGKDGAATPDVSCPPSSRSFSRKSPRAKPADLPLESNGRILKPPSQQEKKLVRALYDFSGSSDELSFRAGDEITVIHEVLDDWWVGMDKGGRKGLFPATYTEPVLKTRRSLPFESGSDHLGPEDQMDDRESIHDYMNPPHSANSLGFDARSVTSTVSEEEEERHLMPIKPSDDEDILPVPPGDFPSTSPPVLWNRTNSDIPKRPPPPPPPPRRSLVTAITPLIPDRRLQTEKSSSARIYMTALNDTAGQDVSPFDSLVDTSSHCTSFEQHPYERKGLCKNCFRVH
ncbi:BAR-domain-containing protein [Boletus coccyginus]|nr:BAR-domain-containing protein [Boletus coccyginus]